MNIKRLVAIGSIAVVALLMMVGAAAADSVTTTFDGFNLGTVNGQDGWKSALPGQVPALPNGYDQEVVTNGGGVPATFGTQSLRMSNAYTNGEFFYQTYSKPATDAAGETLTNHVFDTTFHFTSTSALQQSGLFLSVSPDSYEGSRMSYVGLSDEADGIHVNIFDTPLDASQTYGYAWRETDATPAIGALSRDGDHTIQFLIQLVPGENNDVVRIIIDGTDIGDALGVCFTTWENYYRLDPEQLIPNNNTPPNVNSLEFRSAGTAVPALAGHGYLFDNVEITTRDSGGPAPTTCGATPAFCSPGYWKNASDAAWALVAPIDEDSHFNDVVVPDFYANNIDPGTTTLYDVLSKGATKYGKVAGPLGLNPYNAVGAALTAALPGDYVVDPSATCPLNNHGDVIPPPA